MRRTSTFQSLPPRYSLENLEGSAVAIERRPRRDLPRRQAQACLLTTLFNNILNISICLMLNINPMALYSQLCFVNLMTKILGCVITRGVRELLVEEFYKYWDERKDDAKKHDREFTASDWIWDALIEKAEKTPGLSERIKKILDMPVRDVQKKLAEHQRSNSRKRPR